MSQKRLNEQANRSGFLVMCCIAAVGWAISTEVRIRTYSHECALINSARDRGIRQALGLLRNQINGLHLKGCQIADFPIISELGERHVCDARETKKQYGAVDDSSFDKEWLAQIREFSPLYRYELDLSYYAEKDEEVVPFLDVFVQDGIILVAFETSLKLH